MIPKFPKFKLLELKDKAEIEKITKKFQPYSDYNFVSLFSWDINNKTKISLLNNNLVIKSQDYVTTNDSYSFLGVKNVENTSEILIAHALSHGVEQALYHIPEPVISNFNSSNKFIVEEDKDNFDYILLTAEIIALKGKKWRGKKNFINRFNKIYGKKAKVINLDLTNKNSQHQVLKLFLEWEKRNKKNRNETNNELQAIQKLLNYSGSFKLTTIGIVVDDKLKGFSINEVTWDKYGMIHYEKADTSHTGINQFLKQQSAIEMERQGCKYINYEQDLGIPELRRAKKLWRPVKFLKKYKISLRNED